MKVRSLAILAPRSALPRINRPPLPLRQVRGRPWEKGSRGPRLHMGLDVSRRPRVADVTGRADIGERARWQAQRSGRAGVRGRWSVCGVRRVRASASAMPPCRGKLSMFTGHGDVIELTLYKETFLKTHSHH